MDLMDLLSNEEFLEYTDYYEKLNGWGEYTELTRRNSSKNEIAKIIKITTSYIRLLIMHI